jgi:hypothetical protein
MVTKKEYRRRGGRAMSEELAEDMEFTEEQLRAALKRVGREAQQQAFDKGRPVFFVKNGALIARHPDGSETVIKPAHSGD